MSDHPANRAEAADADRIRDLEAAVASLAGRAEEAERERDEAGATLNEIAELAGPGGDDTPFGRVESAFVALRARAKRAEAERVAAGQDFAHASARVMNLGAERIKAAESAASALRARVEALEGALRGLLDVWPEPDGAVLMRNERSALDKARALVPGAATPETET